MQAKTWTLLDKMLWGPGPWIGETDKEQWTTDAGIRCLIVRSERSGCWRGYIALPPGHPWHEADSETIGWPIEREITYTAFDVGQPDNLDRASADLEDTDPRPLWWIGFHTDSFLDIAPARDARERADGHPPIRLGSEVYNDARHVRALTEVLAAAAVVHTR